MGTVVGVGAPRQAERQWEASLPRRGSRPWEDTDLGGCSAESIHEGLEQEGFQRVLGGTGRNQESRGQSGSKEGGGVIALGCWVGVKVEWNGGVESGGWWATATMNQTSTPPLHRHRAWLQIEAAGFIFLVFMICIFYYICPCAETQNTKVV